jgi:transposase
MKEIGESDYHFITSLTLTHHKDLLDIPLSRFDSFSELRLEGTSAHRTKKEVWGKERTIVITRSDNLLAGQLAGINTSLGKKRAELRGLRTKLRRSQLPGARGKGYTEESLQKRLKSIVSGQFTAEILKSEIRQSEGFLDFRFWTDSVAYNQLIRTRLGKRILCTDNESWSTEQIILGSRAQSCVEDAFKEMKNPHWTSFSPAFHWTDQKLRVHCFYCLLSLTLSSLLARKSAQANINLSTHALYEQLTDVTEVLNFYAMDSGAGRPRVDYVLSERSSLQDKLCRLFNVYALSRCAP